MMITGAFKTEKVHVIMNTPKEKGEKKKKTLKQKREPPLCTQLTKRERNPDFTTRFDHGIE